MGSAAALIIAAIVTAVGGVISNSITSNDLKKAGEESERLAMLKRQDDIDYNNKQAELQKYSLDTGRQGLAFQKREARLNRQERAEERGHGRRRQNVSDALSFINADQNRRNNFVSIWKGAA